MDTLLATKKDLIKVCVGRVRDRVQQHEKQLSSIRESRDNETKSSVGDKYETGRAMMQIEEEKCQAQLLRTQADLDLLHRLDQQGTTDRIESGALVETTHGNYFLSISLGKVPLQGKDYFCLSVQSPLGQALLGKTTGDEVSFRERRFRILAVC